MANRKAVSSSGPAEVRAFATELRKMVAEAGNPSNVEMSKHIHFSRHVIGRALKGEELPPLELVLAIARHCASDEPTADWTERWGGDFWRRRWLEAQRLPDRGERSASHQEAVRHQLALSVSMRDKDQQQPRFDHLAGKDPQDMLQGAWQQLRDYIVDTARYYHLPERHPEDLVAVVHDLATVSGGSWPGDLLYLLDELQQLALSYRATGGSPTPEEARQALLTAHQCAVEHARIRSFAPPLFTLRAQGLGIEVPYLRGFRARMVDDTDAYAPLREAHAAVMEHLVAIAEACGDPRPTRQRGMRRLFPPLYPDEQAVLASLTRVTGYGDWRGLQPSLLRVARALRVDEDEHGRLIAEQIGEHFGAELIAGLECVIDRSTRLFALTGNSTSETVNQQLRTFAAEVTAWQEEHGLIRSEWRGLPTHAGLVQALGEPSPSELERWSARRQQVRRAITMAFGPPLCSLDDGGDTPRDEELLPGGDHVY
jgi:hypothetical protein